MLGHHENVMEEISDPDRLREIYEQYIRRTAVKGRDGIRPRQLSTEIGDLSTRLSGKLRAGTFKFTTYKMLLKSKGPNKYPRIISVPTARDRIVLKSIAVYLAARHTMSTETAQAKVGRIRTALKDETIDSFVRLDIANFFPSILHEKLQIALRRIVHDERVVDLILSACSTATAANESNRTDAKNSRGVPQGLSVSGMLAEIYLREFDILLSAGSDYRYFRYVDDVIILCKREDVNKVFDFVSDKLCEMGLEVHRLGDGSKSEIGPICDGFDYLGYFFDGSQITVREFTRLSIEHRLAHVFTKYKYGLDRAKKQSNSESDVAEKRSAAKLEWYLNLKISGCIHEQKRRGWLTYYAMIDDMGLLKRLDVQVGRLMKRFHLQNSFVPKTFIRTYWAIKNPTARRRKYIPNFDEMPIWPKGVKGSSFNAVDIDCSSKVGILYNIFSYRESWLFDSNDDQIQEIFSKRIRRVVVDLEHDVTSIS